MSSSPRAEPALPRVAVLGRGRVGHALAQALRAADVGVTGPRSARDFTDIVDLATNHDLLLLTVPDDAIPDVVAALAGRLSLSSATAVVHCSGAVSIEALAPLAALGAQTGSWHPLQAFPFVGTPLRPGITMAVTAAEPLRTLLLDLAERIAAVPMILADVDKPRYHAAAVLAANYSITLAALASRLLQEAGCADPVAAVTALQASNVEGLAAVGLPGALTGPLVRGDLGTIRRHLEALADTEADGVYRTLGLSTLSLVAERGGDPETIRAARTLLEGPSR
ncbi:MAG: Rossmann-like and DUF2520 domain-containing protein [Micropruina sp.]